MKTFKDHVGDRFGMLYVIGREPNRNGKTMWKCVCDCGEKAIVSATNLRTGNSTSCGCTNSNVKNKNLDITGQRFGKLVAVSVNPSTHSKWLCRCDCGTEREVKTAKLLAGQISCGCLEAVVTTHGKSKSASHRIWTHMLGRCGNPTDANWKRYGGRGIKVCERWRVFENFYADMGDKPNDLSIDRIDVNGDYEPGNCRWATCLEQASNKTNNRWVTVAGERMTLSQACRYHEINVKAVEQRLKSGWSVGRAVLTPVRPMKKRRMECAA